jgi:hypothetical protein
MVKKFFTAVIAQNKHRVFLDDVKLILKRSKKHRPALPLF